MHAVKWIASAIAVLGLAAVNLILGMSLLPPRMEAARKGIFVPWAITWGMIWVTVLIGVAVSGFLIAIGVNKAPPGEHRSHSRA
jgi:hypothetical protein